VTNEPQSNVFEFCDFRLDAAKRLLLKGDDKVPVPLTPKVFDTLLYLVEHHGETIEKDRLMNAVWTDTIVEENNLSQNISILRRILGEKRGEHRFIATIPGKGFKFIAPVSVRREIQNPEFNRQAAAPNAFLANANQAEKTDETKQKSNRFWLAVLAVLSILALGAAGYFSWLNLNYSAANPKVKTIAVLPFKPLVAENRDEALELGMADTLISRLGGTRETIVRPISSVRRYGGLEQDAVQAGRALAVDSVLDGNIQRWGDKIRANVRLIKVTDGSMLWSETFDEKFTDVFVVQDAIANKVATALALRLSGDEQQRLNKHSTKNAQAYELYLRGRFHYFKLTQAEIRKSIAFYQQAVELDPNYALAYAGIADAYRTLPIAGWMVASKEAMPQAKEAAKKALQIDENLVEAYVVLGWVGFLYDWDWNEAEKQLKKAVELNPNSSDAQRAYAHLLSNSGRHAEAAALGKQARELDPLSLINHALEAQFLFYGGRDAEAIDRLQKAIELDPNFWIAHNVLGRVFARQERYDEAVAEFNKAIELSGGGSTEPFMQLGYALAKSGRRDEAVATLEKLKSLAAEGYVPAYNFAVIYNGLGEKEKALNYLEKSFEQREVQLAFIKIDTRWDNLRAEPRFAEIIKQMNLE
jgi:DNA-binding winged helix-turn-helix (wHTH) protein/TolB-like protein/cytochrome c-type biogenesis protein CcmH/NrfG